MTQTILYGVVSAEGDLLSGSKGCVVTGGLNGSYSISYESLGFSKTPAVNVTAVSPAEELGSNFANAVVNSVGTASATIETLSSDIGSPMKFCFSIIGETDDPSGNS